MKSSAPTASWAPATRAAFRRDNTLDLTGLSDMTDKDAPLDGASGQTGQTEEEPPV